MSQEFEQDRVNCKEQKAVQQPMMQQPMMQQPMMQQPMMQQPMMQQPMMQQPMMQQPGMQCPSTHQGACPNMHQGIQQPMMQCNMSGMDDLDERDMVYMKKMYPELCQRIQGYVEGECDRMDYSGSPMYEDYPDQESVEQMVDRVYERIKSEMPEVLSEGDMDRQGVPRNRLVRSLAGALLLTELFGRRRGYRRRYPFYYGTGYGYPYYQYPYPYY